MAAKCIELLHSLTALRLGTSSSSPASIGILRHLGGSHNCPMLHQSHGFHSSALLHGGRKRSEWRQDRVPANTRLRLDKPERIKVKKAFGGHRKIKAYRLNKGVYFWKSIDVELECPILKVVHNTANKDFNKLGVMVKGTIVAVDSDPFKTWCNTYFNKEEEKSSEVHSSIDDLRPLLDSGKLYAKITTRPGQVGVCNGYILEGDELETLFNNRQDLRLSQDTHLQT